MRATITTRAAEQAQGGLVPRGRGRRALTITPAGAVIGAATLLALGLRAYLVARPGLLAVTQYDDGPYFGSAVRLAHGVLPYRDFVFVQPPGITLLMSPVAAVSNLAGTAYGMAAARVLTVAAGTAAVTLAGLLARHRGLPAVIVTCAIMAVYPPGAAAAHTLLLEPWLVLCCLAGTLAVFDGGRLATSCRRLATGGALFGLAGAVKSWAIVPVLVIVVLSLPWPRGGLAGLLRAAAFAAGVAAGWCACVLPFAAVAPGAFYHDVIGAQLGRNGGRVPLAHRLQVMLGSVTGQSWPRGAAVATLVMGGHVAAWAAARRPLAPLAAFALITAVLVVVMFLWPPYFASHYAAFLAPFLALAIALAWPAPAPGRRARRWLALPAGGLAVAAVIAVAAAAAMAGTVSPRSAVTPPAAAARVIPAGACAVTDQASYLLLANRFTSAVPGCPQMVDSLGTDLALSGGRRPGTGAARVPALAKTWRRAFWRAGYVLLSDKNELRIPWTPWLARCFHEAFRPKLRGRDYTVYQRRPRPGAGSHRRRRGIRCTRARAGQAPRCGTAGPYPAKPP
jgi:hypothetical protein